MYIITKYLPQYASEAVKYQREGQEFLGWSEDIEIDIYHLYYLDNCNEEQRTQIVNQLFSATKSEVFTEMPDFDKDHSFRFRQVTGQYNEHEQMVESMIHTLLGYEDIKVQHSKVYTIPKLSEEKLKLFKEYLLNPVENIEIALDAKPFVLHESSLEDLKSIDHFTQMSSKDLEELSQNFSMDLDDLTVCQHYFQQEGRQPNVTELKVIDTYWSDHCRHTTFNTHLDKIEIEKGPYQGLFTAALEDYFNKRKELNRDQRPVTLMDLGTIQAKYLIQKGMLTNVEVSAEINACALEIKVDVDGSEEDWILYFKNETHNHPTEIEPFGGASTCVGGGVRDPLSGRSWVYQAMRISGAKNPTLPIEETHPDKLPQRTIAQKALEGNCDYANQVGVAGAYAEEVYHPGFEAKRLETGALISAAPRQNIVRLEPTDGDKIVLLGGRTGRDGLGAAVGSSQIQTEESLEDAGAEVQKGAPAVERKIMRLFRNGQATQLIKRCNDFGAGGVSVAVGELADGLEIDLDAVPVKYPGMHGGEIALSESQERMAVVIAPDNLAEFLAFAEAEDVEYAVIATVTADKRMKMTWHGQEIINLSRDFLDSNGAEKHAQASLQQPVNLFAKEETFTLDQAGIETYVSSLNRASQQGMAEQFDASIGRATILYPYGGKYRQTKELGMVSKLPVDTGSTTTTSGMAYGYHPNLAQQSPFHGGYYAVIESVSRMVALGFNFRDIRLTFQEYFENLKDIPERWGKPVLALLGANQAMDGLEIASIGGKDSMSGTYNDIDVPPTLISFAVAQGHQNQLLSRAFKQEGSQVVLIENALNQEGVIDLTLAQKIYQRIHELAQDQKILAASTVGYNGILKEILDMSYGNRISLAVDEEMISRLTEPMMGGFILEVAADENLDILLTDLPYQLLGQTQAEVMTLANQEINLDSVLAASHRVLQSVYPLSDSKSFHAKSIESNFSLNNPVSQPQALVPVLFGTNGEYDLQAALKAAGFTVEMHVIKDSSAADFQASLTEFIDKLAQCHLLALPNGYVYGNQPEEPGRAWQMILNRPEMKEAIHRHLAQQRLIMGSGTGFLALIKSGLIEHGQVTGETHIQVLPNHLGKFMANIYKGQVVSQGNAFTAKMSQDEYTAPVATSYGRLDVSNADLKEEQIVAVYQEYFADEHIDALASANGLVFGSLSLSERVDSDLYQNIEPVQLPPFYASAYQYFQEK